MRGTFKFRKQLVLFFFLYAYSRILNGNAQQHIFAGLVLAAYFKCNIAFFRIFYGVAEKV